MSDLILLFDQIQLFSNSRIVLVFVLAHLKQNLDHVLSSLVDVGLVQDTSELVEYSQSNSWLHLFKKLPNFSRQANRDLDRIVGGLVQEQ